MIKSNNTKFPLKIFIITAISVLLIAAISTIWLFSNKVSDFKGITLKSGNDTINVQLCESNLLKVSFLPNGKSTPNTEVISKTKYDLVKAKVKKGGGFTSISTDKMVVKINNETNRISVYDTNNNLLIKEQDVSKPYDDRVAFDINKGDNFYGVSGYNATADSSELILRNEGGDATAGEQGNCGAPLIWSTRGYGVLVDSDGGYFTISGAKMSFEEPSKKDINYYVMVGSPNEIMSTTAEISGKPPMFPKWAMGFTNTEWGIDEKELTNIVNTYRSKNIPIDNYCLDFDWKAWGQDNYGEFRWNTDKFPSGPSGKLKADMDAKGIKLTGIMKPRIGVDTVQGKYATDNNLWWPNKESYIDYFSGKKVNDINFHLPESRKWFFDNSKNAMETGISGWWNDEADAGFDNTQFLDMQKGMYEGQRATNDLRAWSINRNFYLGAQKYAYGMWSGDIGSGFDVMANQRERMLSAVNLGEVKWGMDIGGFNGEPTPENYARWIQFGAFTPIFRVHGQQNLQRQPWSFGPVAEAASKKAMVLRYQLIPYIYSYERKAYTDGIGLVRPLNYDYPKDEKLSNYVDAWMFGDYLLAAPVVNEGETSKEIYLPEGTWIDYFKGKKYAGNTTINYELNATTWQDIPLFIKKGAILPTQDSMNYVGEKPVTDIYLDIFPDIKKTSFKYYDDDGLSYNYEKGEYFIQNMTVEDSKGTFNFNISDKEGSYTPKLKYYICKFHDKSAQSVKINNTEVKKSQDLKTLMSSNEECFATGKDIHGDVTYVKVVSGMKKEINIK